MEKMYTWTCPGEYLGYCDSGVRGEYGGPCVECPLREIVDREVA